MSAAHEINCDAVVGPSHHFGGLAWGNLASMSHAHQVSNPRAAALEGLEKAWRVSQLGVPQAILPCQQRPHLGWLRALGFSGSVAQILDRAASVNPRLLSAAYSSSSMWIANAATISPSIDSADGQLHASVANLVSGLHRSIETSETLLNLKSWLSHAAQVHEPLPSSFALRDEGAANHTRLGSSLLRPGFQLFVHGDSVADSKASADPTRYPARQSWLACQALIQRHALTDENTLCVQQSSEAIDAGVFHNDVISVGHRDLLWVHEQAFVDQSSVLKQLKQRYEAHTQEPLRIVEVSRRMLELSEAVRTYLFNSQWVSDSQGKWHVLFPAQCAESKAAQAAILELQDEVPEIAEVHYVSLDQSMGNGGGPACLRLRIIMSEQERRETRPCGWLTATRYSSLKELIKARYRDRLEFNDFRDPEFAQECWETAAQVRTLLGFQP